LSEKCSDSAWRYEEPSALDDDVCHKSHLPFRKMLRSFADYVFLAVTNLYQSHSRANHV
jgi:hypothetical protein